MAHIHIRTVSRETKIMYPLWVCVVVLTLAYIALIAGSMVYGVEKKVADAGVSRHKQLLADREAQLLATTATLELSDALTIGLQPIETKVATSGDVRLGRSDN
jgi:H+/Cl- antiporter ClcA